MSVSVFVWVSLTPRSFFAPHPLLAVSISASCPTVAGLLGPSMDTFD